MFWGDRIKEDIAKKYGSQIQSGLPLVIRDEKTASGRVHVGSMRGVAIHGIIDEILAEEGIAHTFLYEINDFDLFDGLPVYLDEAIYRPHMGKLLCEVPSPVAGFANYAEYFGQEFEKVILASGFKPKFYRSSEFYKGGKFNGAIRLALENAELIRDIYKKVSGSVKQEDWLPISVICEKCGKVGTTRARDFDGETVAYTCGDFVSWAVGCGHEGRLSPFDGHAKLPWKVEWAAKFMVHNVTIEGGGKDHSTKGGAREIADTIAREVFQTEPPMNIPYEFFQVGGKKMSSSKGAGSSSKEIADLLPADIFRLLLIQKEPSRVLEFDPSGDTIPILFDNFDTYAKKYFTDKENKSEDDFIRIFELAHMPEERNQITERHLPRFSTVAFISQMQHIDPVKEIEKLQEISLTEDDKKELTHRISYARKWISEYAPDEYKFEIQKELPEAARNLNALQKEAIGILLSYIESTPALDGQALHAKLHEIKEQTKIEPKELFSALYQAILGRSSGPKAGWFLSVLDRDFLLKRLREIV